MSIRFPSWKLAGVALALVLSALTAISALADNLFVIQPMPALPTKYPWVAGVSCSAANACTAVGNYSPSAGGEVPLAERWDGTAWTTQTVPGAGGGILHGVSCPSATSCFAVGTGPGVPPLVERWNGSSWSMMTVQTPSGAAATWLDGVSCPSTTSCTAVGGFEDAFGQVKALVETLAGSGWTLESMPVELGDLNSVSCVAAGCLAVGIQYGPQDQDLPLALRQDGQGGWAREDPPLPSTGSTGEFMGVSCPSLSACTVVGWYANAVNTVLPLGERSTGPNAWTTQFVPYQPGSPTTDLYGVSCPSATNCTAVGTYHAWNGNWYAIAETWNGSGWTGEEPPDPTGATSTNLNGVSCASATACTTVGTSLNAARIGATLAEAF